MNKNSLQTTTYTALSLVCGSLFLACGGVPEATSQTQDELRGNRFATFRNMTWSGGQVEGPTTAFYSHTLSASGRTLSSIQDPQPLNPQMGLSVSASMSFDTSTGYFANPICVVLSATGRHPSLTVSGNRDLRQERGVPGIAAGQLQLTAHLDRPVSEPEQYKFRCSWGSAHKYLWWNVKPYDLTSLPHVYLAGPTILGLTRYTVLRPNDNISIGIGLVRNVYKPQHIQWGFSNRNQDDATSLSDIVPVPSGDFVTQSASVPSCHYIPGKGYGFRLHAYGVNSRGQRFPYDHVTQDYRCY